MKLKTELVTLLSHVEELREGGQLAAARDVLGEAIAAEPDAGGLWELLGLVNFEIGDVRTAESALERASLLCPLKPRGQLALAKCYDQSGHREAAAAIYCHLASFAELEAGLLEPLAAGLGRAGNAELALEVCRRAAKLMPESADPLVGIVHYMRRLRRPMESILPVMFRAHQLDPENAEYRISLAWMLYQLDRSEDAAELLEPVPFAESSCIRCLTLMKQVFERAGDVERADVCRWRLESLAGDCSLRRARREGDSED
jgi:predicted Zn-dependent protease